MKKEIILIENMSELGAGTRGSSLGFSALELAALKFDIDVFNRYPVNTAPTNNNALYNKWVNPHAKYIGDIVKVSRNTSDFILLNMHEKSFPVIISGDHSNAVASISAISAAYPEKRLGVIWVDAHADLHSPYTSPSGNMHGMPLGALLGLDNLECKICDPLEETVKLWEELKNLQGISPKVRPEDVVFFSVRDTEKPENTLMSKHSIRNFEVDELRSKGLDHCLSEADHILSNCDLIYVSFDVDSMDCELVSKGTGTPVPHGLSPEEAESILKHFSSDKRLVCLEVVEINPLLDEKGNVMAETSVRILDNVIRVIENTFSE